MAVAQSEGTNCTWRLDKPSLVSSVGVLPEEEAEPSFPGKGGETEVGYWGQGWSVQEDEGSGDDAVTAQRARASAAECALKMAKW